MDSFDINSMLYTPITEDERDYFIFADAYNDILLDFLVVSSVLGNNLTPKMSWASYSACSPISSISRWSVFAECRYKMSTIKEDPIELGIAVINFLDLLRKTHNYEQHLKLHSKLVNATTNVLPFNLSNAGMLLTLKIKLSIPLIRVYENAAIIKSLNT